MRSMDAREHLYQTSLIDKFRPHMQTLSGASTSVNVYDVMYVHLPTKA